MKQRSPSAKPVWRGGVKKREYGMAIADPVDEHPSACLKKDALMEMSVLGGSGMHVSRLCLGTMMLGSMGNRDEAECARIIAMAIDAGINFIDTADVYSRGESEAIIGKSVRGKRDRLVIATKFGLPMGSDPNRAGSSRRWIRKAVEDSLRRLGTDYIDLYQIHRMDPDTEMDELLFALTDLVREGKIRSFGTSMCSPDRIVEAQWTAQKYALLRPRCEQAEYSILARDIERYVLPACARYGMGVITWSPLNGGFLSGRYKRIQDLTADSRLVRFGVTKSGQSDAQGKIVQRKLDAVEQLAALASTADMPLVQLAVAFTLRNKMVTSSIIGPRTLAQLESLLPVVGLKVEAAIWEEVDAISPPGSYFVVPDNDIIRAKELRT